MKLETILLILIGSLSIGCNEENFEGSVNPKTENSAVEIVETSADTSGEGAVQPVPITGAYLYCQEFAEERTETQSAVACRLESDGQVIENASSQITNLVWNQSSQGSTVTVSVAEAREGWLRNFKIEASAGSIQTDIDISLSLTLGSQSYDFQSQVSIIWDPDCALAPLDFESLSNSQIPAEGLVVDSQFTESHGITFSTISGNPVFIGQYGGMTPIAYYGGPDNVANYLAPDQNTGQFFITDGHKQAEQTDTLVVSYGTPASEAYLELIDIDFSETYVVQAYDQNDQIIHEVQVASESANFRDGMPSAFRMQSPDGSASIHKLHVYGFNPPGATGIGFGLDNFSPRCIP
ncbi:hypothetical protein [Pseudobacteriovorax antillogorgiicola]|uniref:Uncharacterized protein n=1 Tax=Pseudobacteriovorax antillogorgiicola TaxID=1513793 RepID=A0A1Y6C4I1_9BACT|nr:hypothetical protein [Pseudobacteriovorax antillogorgiicola]TCS49797.1 hypothetical protein EDD56_11442 [Pseudobacteriovorax antillogorgiicola]SMF43001.1 hypothetical protein SAMN06296036_11341 [Pseudobacteriovorax antillogorgiicola]